MFSSGMGWLSLIIIAYLVGSFPSAYLAGRFKGVDIRMAGDRNMGAANAYIVLGPRAGIIVAMADMGKGAVAVLIARSLIGTGLPEMMAAVSAVVGHNWPFFSGFRGGRGAATALGALMTILSLATIPLALMSLIVLRLSRSTTVALSFIFVPLPFLAWYVGANSSMITFSVALPVMVGGSHVLSIWRMRHLEGPEVKEQAVSEG